MISIREALTNLIQNALTHGASTRLSVELGRDENKAWISVLDDGPGISSAEQARLLEPFEVGSGSASGSGLGLAIAAEVAKAHGGELTFPVVENGFCVRLALPL